MIILCTAAFLKIMNVTSQDIALAWILAAIFDFVIIMSAIKNFS